MRNDLYASMQGFSPSSIAERGTGDLMTRASSDVSAVKQLVGFGGLSLVSTTLAYGGAIAAMLAIDPWLTLWAMARLRCSSCSPRASTPPSTSAPMPSRRSSAPCRAWCRSTWRAWRWCARTRWSVAREATFGAANAELLRRSLALARVEAQFSPLMGLIAGVGILVVLWAGGPRRPRAGASRWARWSRSTGISRIWRGRRSRSAGRCRSCGAASRRWAASRRCVDRRRPGTSPRMRREPLRRHARHPLRGLDVRLRRPRARAARRVVRGARAARRSPSWGRRAAANPRWACCCAGSCEPPRRHGVRRRPRRSRSAARGRLRASVGYVPQEAFLFSRSLRDNVQARPRRRRPERPRGGGRVRDRGGGRGLPRGWDTVVGERGLTLSGGQRQRVALARALAGGSTVPRAGRRLRRAWTRPRSGRSLASLGARRPGRRCCS